MNRQTIKKVILYHKKFCVPQMSLEQQAQVIFLAMNYCANVDNPMLLGQDTVIHVLEQAGFKTQKQERVHNIRVST